MFLPERTVGHTENLSESPAGYVCTYFIPQNGATYTAWMEPNEDIKKTKNGGISKDKYCK